MIDAFARFCQTPGQRLVCSAEGNDGGDEFVARITHRLNPGAGAAALQALHSALGSVAEDFAGFFARFNGATLFADERSDTAGISIAPVEMWDGLTEQYMEQREDSELFGPDQDDQNDDVLFEPNDPLSEDQDFDDDDELDIDEDDQSASAWMDTAVAFAEAPHSGNLFLVAIEGEERGNVYYFDADLLEPELFATCFAEFLARIVYCDPPRLLQHLGGYARYSDGKTHTQWVPRRYLAGER